MSPENPAAPGWPASTELRQLVEAALDEDIGLGDATTRAIVSPRAMGEARVIAKAAGRIAGLPVVPLVFESLGAAVTIRFEKSDGDRVSPGDEVLQISGAFGLLLTAERTLLNFLGHLSGIATLTARYVDLVRGTGAVILDTRKTTPGLRLLEKYAVRCGGGTNHRMRLDDELLVKENHIAAAGGVREAVRAVLEGAPDLLLRVEVRNLRELDEAVDAGARALLLDNFRPEEVAAARARLAEVREPVEIEVSGRLTPETVRAYAEAGADRLSVGALTHSAPALDLSMLVELRR